MFVACKVPFGLLVRHKGHEIMINGPHAGLNPETLPPNGAAPDDFNRYLGWGLTELEGEPADVLLDYIDIASKGDGPFSSGAVVVVDSRGDALAAVKDHESVVSGFEGQDPDKMPAGLEKDPDVKVTKTVRQSKKG